MFLHRGVCILESQDLLWVVSSMYTFDKGLKTSTLDLDESEVAQKRLGRYSEAASLYQRRSARSDG
jgi:hypothetical protein